MAATSGFKQQCPSCEAMVPIRDPNLIGRKIDCPQCKYRFVVEDPAAADEAGEEPEEETAQGKRGASALSDNTYTSLLPNDTEQVVHVNVKELVKTSYGAPLLSATGMIRPEAFRQKMGFAASDLDRILMPTSFSQNWT